MVTALPPPELVPLRGAAARHPARRLPLVVRRARPPSTGAGPLGGASAPRWRPWAWPSPWASPSTPTRAATSSSTQHTWAAPLGISWLDRRRRHQPVHHRAHRARHAAGAARRARGAPDQAFVAWMLLLEGACIGSFVSLDLVVFFLFFELTLIPSLLPHRRAGAGGTARRRRTKFFVYTFVGSAPAAGRDLVRGLRPRSARATT